MKNPQRIVLLLLVSLIFTSVFSQSELFYPKKSFTNAVESGDYLWIISDKNGLIKSSKSGDETIYYNKSNSGLLSSNLLCIHKDAQENLWIGTEDVGLLKYDGTIWTTYNTSNSDIPSNHILSINSNQGEIWISTYLQGAAKLTNGNNWTLYNMANSDIAENTISSIHIASNGKVYLGWTRLSVLNGTSWETFSYNDMNCNGYVAIDEDTQGNIWLVSYTCGLAKYNGTDFTAYNVDNSELPINTLQDIYIDENDKLWIASFGNGLATFDGTAFESKIPNIDEKDVNILSGICSDGNENIMLVAANYLIKYDKSIFTNVVISDNTPISCPINKIMVDKNNRKLIATNSEFCVRETNQWSDVLQNRRSADIAVDKNDTIFVATNWGLFKKVGEEWTNYTSENSIIKDNDIYCVTADTNDVIWFSPKDKGIQAYKNGKIITVDYANLCSLTITELFTDSKGYIWAGSYRQGISYYKDSSWHTYDIDLENPDDFLYIRDIVEDQNGTIWIATMDGVVKAEDTTFTIVNRNSTEALTIDNNNNLWTAETGSNQSLVKYTETDSVFFNPFISRNLFDQINTMSFDQDGFLWIGYLKNGLMKFDTNNPNHNEITNPPTDINELSENKSDINIFFYPNPSSGLFNIKTNGKEIREIIITDIQGKTVYKKTSFKKHNIINLKGFNQGFYFAIIKTNDKAYTQKLIIE